MSHCLDVGIANTDNGRAPREPANKHFFTATPLTKLIIIQARELSDDDINIIFMEPVGLDLPHPSKSPSVMH